VVKIGIFVHYSQADPYIKEKKNEKKKSLHPVEADFQLKKKEKRKKEKRPTMQSRSMAGLDMAGH
jgi:hypothetical protein